MTALTVALAIGAVYRLTMLVTSDTITEPARDRVVAYFARKKMAKMVALVECPWCVGWYMALPVAWSAWCFGDRAWWAVPALALTASAVTGAVAHYVSPES